MRRPRAMVFDDDVLIRDMLREFLTRKGYEVIDFGEPSHCMMYTGCASLCPRESYCADVIITDLDMPRMTGIELLRAQMLQGCPLDVRNKAVITGRLGGEDQSAIEALGCRCFLKPFSLVQIADWLRECEGRFDLSMPLNRIEKRGASRRPYDRVVTYFSGNRHVEPCAAQTLNISETGVGLLVQKEHQVGEVITIRGGLTAPSRCAAVRWTRHLHSAVWLVGLTFI